MIVKHLSISLIFLLIFWNASVCAAAALYTDETCAFITALKNDDTEIAAVRVVRQQCSCAGRQVGRRQIDLKGRHFQHPEKNRQGGHHLLQLYPSTG